MELLFEMSHAPNRWVKNAFCQTSVWVAWLQRTEENEHDHTACKVVRSFANGNPTLVYVMQTCTREGYHVERQAGVKLKVCAGCKHARYCSKECQIADFPSHKLVCQS